MVNWGPKIKNKEEGKKKGFFYLSRMPIFIIILAFLFNVIIPQDYLAWAKKTDTMPSPIGEETSVGPGQLLGPNDIMIPPAFGSIKERFQQDKDPKGFIVYIQDLHTHYEAHKNIASIIEHLAKKHDINVIMCEAKSTDKGFAFLRPWTYEEVRRKVAEENLQKGILTGWEVLDLTTDLDLVLQGVEDRDLYMKDMDSFLKAEIFREDALKFVDVLRNIVENLKLHVYSRPLKTFDEKMKLYRTEKTDIAEYVNYLTELARKRRLDYGEFSNLNILLSTLNMEKRIDFNRAQVEREDIITTLAERLLDEEMKTLLDMSMKFKANRISQNEFYQYLLSIAKKLNINIKRYPNFNLYTQYIASYHDLDASKLFEEINKLEDSLAETMFAQEDQIELFQISKNLIILRGLIDFKLTPDEFDYYAMTKTGFDVKNWLEFLRLNSEHYNLTRYVPDDASIILNNLATLEDFYKIAHKRDEAFVKNIEEQFNERNISTAVLTTGGFHTPGVTRRLKEKGYSYVVISPRIEEEMNYEKYHKILKDSYMRLKETAVIGAWSRTELEGAVEGILKEIGVKGIHVATPQQEKYMFTSRRALAIITTEGEAILSLRALELLKQGTLGEFLSLINQLRQEKGAVGPEAIDRLTNLSQLAWEPEREEAPRRDIPRDTERPRPLGEGDYTIIIVREGVVETAPAISIDDKIRVLEEYSVRLGPNGAAEVKPIEGTPIRLLAPAITPQILEIVRPLVPAENLVRNLEVSRAEVIEQRGDLIKELSPKPTRIKLDVDAIATSLEPEERREAFMRYFAFMVESMNLWRTDPSSRIYFDFVGTNTELVNEFKKIYYSLPSVMGNIRYAQLWDDVSPAEQEGAREIAISFMGSAMYFDNPTLYLENRVFEGTNVNFVNWDRAILAALRLALGRDIADEELADRIKGDLTDEATNFAKLKRELLMLSKAKEDVIDHENILNLYKITPKDYNAKNDYRDTITIYIKRIDVVDWQALIKMHELMKEVQLSI